MNSLRGFTKIELGASEYNVKYDINALCSLEQELGNKSLQEIFSQESLNFSWIRSVLWAGLLYSDPKITPKKVGRMLDNHFEKGGSLEDVVQSIMGAITQVLPGNEEKKAKGKGATKKKKGNPRASA